MWTPEESARILQTAKDLVPRVRTFALPQRFQVEHGPDAVVDLLIGHIPQLLE